MNFIIFSVLILLHLTDGVIYRLNETEYLRMPPVYYLEDYESCVHQPNGTYCYVEIDLVSDTPSELLQMIHEYSEQTITHFNHTQLHHGICLTRTCKEFLQNSKTLDHRIALEACLNESLWRDYKLKSRLTREIFCTKLDDSVTISTADIVAGVFFVLLLLLNVIGSLYDFYFMKGDKGNMFLLSFSMKRNWKKLVTQENEDRKRERLKGVHGLRALSIMIVIIAHAPLSIISDTQNPHEFEKTYYDITYHIFYNGTLMVQTFFIMSGCLMAFNIRAYAEKNKLRWIMIPKGIMLRWLRLTPAYAVLLIFTITWIKFLASGPLWEARVGVEARDCYRDGWFNMLYLNNYIENSQCMPHTWYLAADMQLYILGIFVCILANTSRSRKIVYSVLFVIGFFAPGITTYLWDLNPVHHVSPEASRHYFVTDPTFNHLFKRGHTNIPSFIFGLTLGNLIYQGLKDERKVEKFKKLGFLYYLTFPVGVGFILCGMVFYGDRPKLPILVRAALSCLIRPFFCLVVSTLIIGMVFKFENLYRRILEWRGWRIPARISYSAFLIHGTIIRVFTAMNTSLLRMGVAQCGKEGLAILSMTFLFAYPFWLFVEAPLNEAIINVLGLRNQNKKDKTQIEERAIKELDNDEHKKTSIRL